MSHNNRWIRTIGFTLVFLMFFSLSNRYLAYHEEILQNRLQQIYQLDQKIDIVILGNSHGLRGFNPQIIDDALGTYSISLATPGQEMIQSYHLLREVLDRRSIDYVILEAFSLITDEKGKVNLENLSRYNKYRDFFNEIPISTLKIRMVSEIAEPALVPELLLPIINSHGTWKDPGLIRHNLSYVFDPTGKGVEDSFTGIMDETEVRLYRDAEYEYRFEISEYNLEWLGKIQDLLEEHQVKLLVTMAPLYGDFREKSNYWELQREISGHLASRGMTFLDFNRTSLGERPENFAREKAFNNMGEVNFNQHASFIGQYHISRETAEFVREDFPIDQPLITVDRFILSSYLETLDTRGRIVVVTGLENLPGDAVLKHFGRTGVDATEEGDFLLFEDPVDSSDPVGKWQRRSPGDVVLDAGLLSLTIEESEGSQRVTLNQEIFDPGVEGLMVLVYDPLRDEVVEKALFGTQSPFIKHQWR